MRYARRQGKFDSSVAAAAVDARLAKEKGVGCRAIKLGLASFAHHCGGARLAILDRCCHAMMEVGTGQQTSLGASLRVQDRYHAVFV